MTVQRAGLDSQACTRLQLKLIYLQLNDKEANLKMGKDFEQTFLQRRYSNYP